MNPASAFPPADLRPHATADAAFYRAVLHEVIEIGVDVSRMLRGQALALAEAADQSGVDAAEAGVQAREAARIAGAYDRVARAIRRSIAQARRLDEPVAVRGAGGGVRAPVARPLSELSDEELDALLEATEAAEAAEAAERDDTLLDRPIEQVVAAICRDLGLASAATLDPAVVEAVRALAERLSDRMPGGCGASPPGGFAADGGRLGVGVGFGVGLGVGLDGGLREAAWRNTS